MREPMSAGRRHSIRQRADSAVNRTDVEELLRVCAEDVPKLLEDLDVADELRAVLAEAVRERDLAIAHDRQPYPTAWAYEQACRALEEHRQRADKAEAERDTAVATVEKALADAKTIAAERDEARDRLREVADLRDKSVRQRDAAREQVERVRAYAREGCLGSKSAIYRRVGQDLLRIVGTGASDA